MTALDSLSHGSALLVAAGLAPYKPTVEADGLLGLLAWGASAAGVFGLIVVGMQMAAQLRRGEMGEGATYFRGFFFVVVASIVATTAGPIVEMFGPYNP
ncbi:hypothetical protein ACQEU8_03985 [Streptomyces sp. CA-250714]|uniref:hypothetical protein n=1 Tax=Streptomyces sp. CA-250714 TaxID=3240060 RepID=UPI003D8E936D